MTIYENLFVTLNSNALRSLCFIIYFHFDSESVFFFCRFRIKFGMTTFYFGMTAFLFLNDAVPKNCILSNIVFLNLRSLNKISFKISSL